MITYSTFPRAVTWLTVYRALQVWDGESGDTTWERPEKPCVVLWNKPAVPAPWVVETDTVAGELSFFNEF